MADPDKRHPCTIRAGFRRHAVNRLNYNENLREEHFIANEVLLQLRNEHPLSSLVQKALRRPMDFGQRSTLAASLAILVGGNSAPAGRSPRLDLWYLHPRLGLCRHRHPLPPSRDRPHAGRCRSERASARKPTDREQEFGTVGKAGMAARLGSCIPICAIGPRTPRLRHILAKSGRFMADR